MRDQYSFLEKFGNKDELESYKKSLFRHAVLSKNKVNCQICTSKSHFMTAHYIGCSNAGCMLEGVKCPKKYKVLTCLKV